MAIEGYPFLDPPIPPTNAGSAEHCWASVFLNFALTDALLVWVEWIFFCMPIGEFAKEDKAALIAKFKIMSVLFSIYLMCVFGFDTDGPPVQIVMFVWASVVRMHVLYKFVAQYLRETARQPFGSFSKPLAQKFVPMYEDDTELSDEDSKHLHND